MKQPSITCKTCGRTSYHPKDIEHSYCGYCNVFTTREGARAMILSDVLPVPKITAEQLNKRGACIADILTFKRMFGDETVVTVIKARSVAHAFDFGWAVHELLHEQHCKEVYEAVIKRCTPPPDKEGWIDGETSLLEATAEEFARKYIEVYPNVP